MEKLKEFLQRDLFATGAGAELVLVEPGHAIARMQIGPRHHNAIGTAQGGAIFTLADFAFAAAVNSRGHVAVAINCSITFMKAGTDGLLTAEAREETRNAKLGAVTVRVTDEAGDVVAIFQGLSYQKRDPFPVA